MTYYWTTEDFMGAFGETNIWFDIITASKADVAFSVGSSLFVRTASDNANMTIFGEVLNEPFELKLKPGLTQFTNPYPVPIKLNDIVFTGLTGYDWGEFEPGDCIDVWVSGDQGYSMTYYWTTEDYMGAFGEVNIWFDIINATKTDYEIPVGGSVFIKRLDTKDGSASFVPPILN